MLSPFQFGQKLKEYLDKGYIDVKIMPDGVPLYSLTKRGLAHWIFKKLGVKTCL